MVTVIVARYNENVDWVNEIKHKVIIFNKGEPLSLANVQCLPNLGKEGQTFYHYIYDNYDNLDDYTIFLQGDPFDHCSDVIERINNFEKDPVDFYFLASSIHLVALSDDEIYDDNKIKYKIPNCLVYNHIFDVFNIEDIKYTFGVGGQFIVSKQKILSNPREVYGKIDKLLSRTKMPIEGYVIERFPSLIFNKGV